MPNCDHSVVSKQKIISYLLNDTHEIGRGKAKFFKNFGFDIADIGTFKNALIQHSVDRDMESEETTGFGTKYKLICEIQTPDERNPCIVTVWIIEAETEMPKLITAYPS